MIYTKEQIGKWEEQLKNEIGANEFILTFQRLLAELPGENVQDKIKAIEKNKTKQWIRGCPCFWEEYIQRFLQGNYD